MHKFKKPISIAIVGPHYSGKSTVSRLFVEKLGFERIEENWHADPYRNVKSEDRDYLRSQYWFLMETAKMTLNAAKIRESGVSAVLDTFVFSTWCFAKTKLNETDFAVFEQLSDMLGSRLPLPDVVVYLTASVDYLYDVNRVKRVESGVGPAGDKTVPKEWLSEICTNQEIVFGKWDKTPLIKIYVEKTDLTNELNFEKLLSEINEAIQ